MSRGHVKYCKWMLYLLEPGLREDVKNEISLYSSYTYNHPSWIVRYPHRVRNRLVAEEIKTVHLKSG